LESDPEIDIAANIKEVGAAVLAQCKALEIDVPAIRMEPGRSIVADAGMTLYTVGSVKRIPGYKNYVSVDGGMTDNPRFALYRAPYTVALANKMNEKNALRASLVGRCCESGDIIQEDVGFPETVTRGDIAAVMTTGAYNYAMSSNYNRIPRPPVVMLKGGEDKLVVRRETFADICKNDL
jgi:diaminopimelate decarboxylase